MILSDIYTKNTIQGKQTWRNLSIYNGKTYAVRVVLDKYGEELLVANDVLLNDIHPGEWSDVNEGFDPVNPEYAKMTYNKIFFFTDDTTYNYNDEDLRADMVLENPDFFIDVDDEEDY